MLTCSRYMNFLLPIFDKTYLESTFLYVQFVWLLRNLNVGPSVECLNDLLDKVSKL